jgi:polyisoprenyl-phosphate glycosyltransferase
VTIVESRSMARRGKGRSRRTLSIVIPVLNEEAGLDALLARLRPVLERLDIDWDVIFVDDGSTDGTLERLRELNVGDERIKALSLSRNFGKEIASAAGLSQVTADAAVLMDADLQHPPEAIAALVTQWRAGYDIVYGHRTDRKSDSLAQRIAARCFYATFRRLSGTTLPPGAGDFRLLNRKALEAINRMGERVRFNKGIFSWIGFKSIGVPFEVTPSQRGSRWKPQQLLRFAIDGLTSFSTIPLRVWSYLGLLVSLFAIFYAAVFFIQTLLHGNEVPGFPTLFISVLFFSGIQLISLGVIGEYLGRIYEEVKGRPLFLISERLGVEEPHSQRVAAPELRRG